MDPSQEQTGLVWQLGVWNRIADIYRRQIDQRFDPWSRPSSHARLAAGERVLDLGTGTDAGAERAAALVGANGHVAGVDLSPDMLALGRQRMGARGLTNVTLCEGRGERIPADDHAVDVVLSSLALMYVIDRAAAAREIARVLRPGGRLIASVWAGPDACDLNVADFGGTFEALMPLIAGR